MKFKGVWSGTNVIECDQILSEDLYKENCMLGSCLSTKEVWYFIISTIKTCLTDDVQYKNIMFSSTLCSMYSTPTRWH